MPGGGCFRRVTLGTLTVRGPSAVLNEVLSNDLTHITDGQARYTLLPPTTVGSSMT